jgi:ATP-dependent helicase/nuclease subunit B
MHSSVTRLEQFASCAYAHFLRYGLQIDSREESGFAGVDIGNLYHAALFKYSERVEKSEFDWFGISDEVREEYAERSLHEAVEEYTGLSLYDSAENMHMAERMMDIFKQTTWALTRQVQAGTFVPTDFELSFSELGDMDSLKITLEDDKRMQLLGRIDRLDLSRSEGKVYVKIIDYKSGNTKFDLIRIYRGLSLQLVVYMNAALEYTKQKNSAGEVLPAGILYYHIDDPVLEEKNPSASVEELDEELLLALRPDGLVNSEEEIYRSMDQDFEKKSLVIPVEIKKDGTLSERGSHVASTEEFEIIEEYVRKEIVRQAGRIYDGDVAVNPYRDGNESSCTYCPYSAVCGMDGRIPGYGYRRLDNLTKEEALERMRL